MNLKNKEYINNILESITNIVDTLELPKYVEGPILVTKGLCYCNNCTNNIKKEGYIRDFCIKITTCNRCFKLIKARIPPVCWLRIFNEAKMETKIRKNFVIFLMTNSISNEVYNHHSLTFRVKRIKYILDLLDMKTIGQLFL